jgi:hypothetical protein
MAVPFGLDAAFRRDTATSLRRFAGSHALLPSLEHWTLYEGYVD